MPCLVPLNFNLFFCQNVDFGSWFVCLVFLGFGFGSDRLFDEESCKGRRKVGLQITNSICTELVKRGQRTNVLD